MNITEAAALLVKARMLDPRIGAPDEGRATAWAEVLADIPIDVAMAALGRHYQANDTTVMPVHIRRLAREIQRSRHTQRLADIEAHQRAQIEPPTPEQIAASNQHRNTTLTQIRAQLAAKGCRNEPDALKINGSIRVPLRHDQPAKLGNTLHHIADTLAGNQ